MAPAQVLPQLPCMLDAARAADMLVAAEDDHRFKTVMRGLVGVSKAELQRVLGGEERNDMRSCQFRSEVGDEVSQVVFLLCANRAIRDHHAYVLPRE
jgi:hypothetical protein